jgi:hypothetical protein
MKEVVNIDELNPVEDSRVEEATADPVFDELRRSIVESEHDRSEALIGPTAHLYSPVRPIRRASIAMAAIAAVGAGRWTAGRGGQWFQRAHQGVEPGWSSPR